MCSTMVLTIRMNWPAESAWGRLLKALVKRYRNVDVSMVVNAGKR